MDELCERLEELSQRVLKNENELDDLFEMVHSNRASRDEQILAYITRITSLCEERVAQEETRLNELENLYRASQQDNDNRLRYIALRVKLYSDAIEGLRDRLRRCNREIDHLHNQRNALLLERLQHATRQYTELCSILEKNMKE